MKNAFDWVLLECTQPRKESELADGLTETSKIQKV